MEPKTDGRVLFPEFDAPLRTDYSFRHRLQPQHHDKNGRKSVLENVFRDVVDGFVLDYMHLLCIGVNKKQQFCAYKQFCGIKLKSFHTSLAIFLEHQSQWKTFLGGKQMN